MIRLAFICDSFDLGGQELGCLALMERLDRTRFAPYLYTFRPGFLIRKAVALAIPFMVGHDKPSSDQSWERGDSEARERFRFRLAERMRADGIDACMVYAWPDAIPAAREAGVRAIIERVDGTSLTRRLEDKSACARIICEAEAIRREILAQREMLQCRSEQLVVIPNGIDLRRFDPSRYDRDRCRAALGLNPADFVIGTVARMAPEKNLEHLLRAIAVLTSTYGLDGRMVWGVIAGPDGGSRGKLEAEAERLGIANRMKILQATEKVPELLRALDAFVMTSFYEGAPFALLEAIAMGLPVVASAVGAITEIIDGNGILVSVLHPEETARALFQLLSNSELRRSLSHRSEMVRNRYDLDRMVREYERVVTSTLEDTVAPPWSSSVDDS